MRVASLMVYERADLRSPPAIRAKADPKRQVTLGDLHGNAMKLIYFLMREGALELSDEAYTTLHTLYEKDVDEFTAADLATIQSILAAAHWHKLGEIRLIGDVLADRGNNDAITMAVIEAMHAHGLAPTVLFSNHDAEFVRAFLGDALINLGPGQAASLQGLNRSIQFGVIKREAVLNFWREHYAPKLKLLDYHINRSTDPDTFSLFSHAPIGLETVVALAEKFAIPYNDTTVDQLAATIDRINECFSALIVDANASLMDKLELNFEDIDELIGAPISTKHPILRAIWNRGEQDHHLVLPEMHQSYRLVAVHGHEGQDEIPFDAHRHNLDTVLGKFNDSIRADMEAQIAAGKISRSELDDYHYFYTDTRYVVLRDSNDDHPLSLMEQVGERYKRSSAFYGSADRKKLPMAIERLQTILNNPADESIKGYEYCAAIASFADPMLMQRHIADPTLADISDQASLYRQVTAVLKAFKQKHYPLCFDFRFQQLIWQCSAIATGHDADSEAALLPQRLVDQLTDLIKHAQILARTDLKQLHQLATLGCDLITAFAGNNEGGQSARLYAAIAAALEQQTPKADNFTKLAILSELNLKKHVFAAYDGDDDLPSAFDYLKRFKTLVAANVATGTLTYPYDPASADYDQFHWHALSCIIQSCDTLEGRGELRGRDAINAVDACFNVYQAISNNNTGYWDKFKRCPSEDIGFYKPSYLDQRSGIACLHRQMDAAHFDCFAEPLRKLQAQLQRHERSLSSLGQMRERIWRQGQSRLRVDDILTPAVRAKAPGAERETKASAVEFRP